MFLFFKILAVNQSVSLALEEIKKNPQIFYDKFLETSFVEIQEIVKEASLILSLYNSTNTLILDNLRFINFLTMIVLQKKWTNDILLLFKKYLQELDQ
jgi:hypothetical protein